MCVCIRTFCSLLMRRVCTHACVLLWSVCASNAHVHVVKPLELCVHSCVFCMILVYPQQCQAWLCVRMCVWVPSLHPILVYPQQCAKPDYSYVFGCPQLPMIKALSWYCYNNYYVDTRTNQRPTAKVAETECKTSICTYIHTWGCFVFLWWFQNQQNNRFPGKSRGIRGRKYVRVYICTYVHTNKHPQLESDCLSKDTPGTITYVCARQAYLLNYATGYTSSFHMLVGGITNSHYGYFLLWFQNQQNELTAVVPMT